MVSMRLADRLVAAAVYLDELLPGPVVAQRRKQDQAVPQHAGLTRLTARRTPREPRVCLYQHQPTDSLDAGRLTTAAEQLSAKRTNGVPALSRLRAYRRERRRGRQPPLVIAMPLHG